MKKSFAIVLLLAMVLSLAACGEAAPAATPEPTAEPTPAPETLAAEAEELFYKADYTGAFEKLDALETSGITSVQELLGTSYYFGLGVEADSEEAVAQLTKAADQGDAIAMYMLGNAYATGTGTSRDEAKAKEMYAKFIAVGEADSGENADSGRIQAYLADCYAYGKGTDKDIDKAAAAAGAELLTLHCQGGERMCSEARIAADSYGSKAPQLFGVTALTSFGPGEMPGISADPSDFALELAGKARGWGLDGVVCSGHEAARIKASCQGLRCLCPGIRPAGADTDDQQRIMTPARAVQAGADFLVVGRPILKAPSPAEAESRRLKETA